METLLFAPTPHMNTSFTSSNNESRETQNASSHALVNALQAIKTSAAQRIFEKTSLHPTITDFLAEFPFQRTALKHAIQTGEFSKEPSDRELKQFILKRDQIERVTELLESDRPRITGSPPKEAKEYKNLLTAESQKAYGSTDRYFKTYVNHMAVMLFRKQLPIEELKNNHALRSLLVDHISAEWQLLLLTGAPKSILAKAGHLSNVFELDKACKDLAHEFGSSAETAPVMRTALRLLLYKRYPSVAQAKASYEEALADAQKIFGAHPSTKTLVRTAALLVFEKRYESVAESKRAWTKAFSESKQSFGKDPITQPVVRVAAFGFFIKRYRSMGEAKAIFDRALKDAKRAFSGNKQNQKLIRTAALLVLKGHYKSVQACKGRYETIQKQANKLFGVEPHLRSLTRTAALLVLNGNYRSVQEARNAYLKLYEEATEVFGDSPASTKAIRSAAFYVFEHRMQSIAEAKEIFDQSEKDGKKALRRSKK